MNIKQIELLTRESKYNEALSACRLLLEDDSIKKADVLRTRAYVYSHMGDYQSSLKDREKVLQLEEATLKDIYLAADNSLSLMDFKQAAAFLRELLELGEKQGEHWFDSAAYFLQAYTMMELGNYTDSLVNLEKSVDIEPNCAMPLPGLGMVGHKQLKAEIIKRQGNQ